MSTSPSGTRMHMLRALIHRHHRLAGAMIIMAFFIKAMVPAGYMVSTSADMVLRVTICADASAGHEQMQIVLPGKNRGTGNSGSTDKRDGPCAFAGLTQALVGGADAILLALAFAIILILGLAPTMARPSRAHAHLRPPLRGPPIIV